MGYCPLRCSANFRSSRSVVVYFRPHGNMIGGARPGRGALVQMHCQGGTCITNHFRRLNGSMTKNYGIIGGIRIQRNKNSRFHRRRDNALKMDFGWLRPISLMFFSGGHRAYSTLSPLTLKIRFYILCFMVFRRTAWNTTRSREFLWVVLDNFAANYHLLTPKHIYYETLFSCERLFATASQAYQGWRCVSEAFAGTDACTGAGNVVGIIPLLRWCAQL